MDKEKKGIFGGKFFAKLKSIKHIEIYIAILALAIIVLIYFSNFGNSSATSEDEIEYTSIVAYAKAQESKLKDTLLKIEGVGDLKVMLTYDMGLERIIAYSTDETETTVTNSNGSTTTVQVTKTPVIVGSGNNAKPILLGEKLPTPKSVLVVASGAKDVRVKLSIITALETLLKLPAKDIVVLC